MLFGPLRVKVLFINVLRGQLPSKDIVVNKFYIEAMEPKCIMDVIKD